LITTASAAYSFYGTIVPLDLYYKTKDRTLLNGGKSWPPNAKLWPTFLMDGVSGVSLLMSLATLLAYFWGVQSVKALDGYFKYLGYAVKLVTAFLWGINTAAFEMANDTTALRGWSCSPAADAIKEEVQGFLNFDLLCRIQVSRPTICKSHSLWLTLFTFPQDKRILYCHCHHFALRA
jgi:nitrogen fixation-related uncharacterized protein